MCHFLGEAYVQQWTSIKLADDDDDEVWAYIYQLPGLTDFIDSVRLVALLIKKYFDLLILITQDLLYFKF